MADTLTELSIAGQLALSNLARRVSGKSEPAPDRAAFAAAAERAMANLPKGLAAYHVIVDLPANEAPWRDIGVSLAIGEEVSLFMVGRVVASSLLDIWIEPKLNIWAKIGPDGEISRSTHNTRTIKAGQEGKLLLGNYFPNDWKDTKGTLLQENAVYNAVSGGTTILAIKWAVPAAEGLQALKAEGPLGALIAKERARLQSPPALPQGWRPLFNIGDSAVFKACQSEGGGPAICAHAEKDVSIIQRDAPFPVSPDTTIAWRWKVDELPSPLREDTLPTHDYISIAIEFDTGWDITYFWSRKLPAGTGFICPLPNWKHREYHVAVRSGTADLGKWLSESRNLHNDYRDYMGALSAPPSAIVRIWFIAVALFQRNRARATFSDVVLTGTGDSLKVL